MEVLIFRPVCQIPPQNTTAAEDGGIFLIQACKRRTPSSQTHGIGLGGLVPRPDSVVLGGLSLRRIVAIYARTGHV